MGKVTQDFCLPPGRLVWGNIYQMRERRGDNGQPKLGADGQPMRACSFGVAIKKGSEQQWAQTPWGMKLYSVGQQGFPTGQYQHPSFAWKVTDGDSTIPNKAQKRPCDQEGYPGHWIVSCSTSAAPPKTYQLDDRGQPVLWPQVDAINPGDYVEVFISVTDNAPAQSPGVYINPVMVCFRGYGPRIFSGPDVTVAGFGQAPAPVGASAAPLAAMPAMAPTPPLPAPVAAPPMPPAPVAVAPNPAFTAPPMPPAPPAPPAGPQMTAAAQGRTYQQYRDAGWTDDQMRAQGLLA